MVLCLLLRTLARSNNIGSNFFVYILSWRNMSNAVLALSQTLALGLSNEGAAASQKPGIRNLLELDKGHDGICKITLVTVERYATLLEHLLDWCAKFKDLPSTKGFREALALLDKTYKVTRAAGTVAAQRAYIQFEAEKLHIMLSYLFRLIRRSKKVKECAGQPFEVALDEHLW